MAKKTGDQTQSSTTVNADLKAGEAGQRNVLSTGEMAADRSGREGQRAQANRLVKKARRGVVSGADLISDAAEGADAQDTASAESGEIQLAQAGAAGGGDLPPAEPSSRAAGALPDGGASGAGTGGAGDAGAAGGAGGAGGTAGGVGAGDAAAAAGAGITGVDAAAALAAGTGLSTGTLLGGGAGVLALAAAGGGGGGGGGSSAPPSPTIRINAIASDNVINASEHGAQVTVSGTTTYVEDGRTVSVLVSGHTYTTTVTSGAWTLSVPSSDVAALAEGSYQVGAVVANGGGLVSTDTRSISVDTTATITIGTVSSDNVINTTEHGATVVISGTSSGIEDGRTVTVSAGASSYTATVSGNAWTVNVPSSAVAALTDGTYTLSASASDLAGNPATNTRAVVVDTTASIAITAIATDDRVNTTEHGAQVTLSGTTVGVESGNVVTVTVNDLTYTASVASNTWSVTMPSSAVAGMLDGGYNVHATVSDNAGNPAAANRMFTVDTNASIAIGVVSTDDLLNVVDHTLVLPIAGTAAGIEDGRTVLVSLHGHTYSTTVSAGAWAVAVPSSDVATLTDGDFTISASATDAAGNAASATHLVHVDSTASISLNAIVGDNVINAVDHTGAVTISGATIGVEDGRTVVVTVAGHTYTASVASSAWSLLVPSGDVAALSDGPYTVHASVSDLSGNSAVIDGNLMVDATASIAIATVLGDDVVNAADHQSAVRVNGTTSGIEDGRTVTVSLHGHSYTATVAGAAWSVTVPTSDVATLTDGNYTISASATDSTGNVASATHALHVDVTASIALNAIVGDNVINSADHAAAVTVSGTTTGVEDGRVVSVLVAGHTYTASVASSAWSLSVPSSDVASLRDGPYAVHASVSDLAGNEAVVDASILVDATAAVTIAPVLGDDVMNAIDHLSPLAISGTVVGIEDGRTLTVNLHGHSYTTTVAAGVWNVTVPSGDVVTLTEGNFTISASASDASGNPASATRALRVDTLATISLDPIVGDNVVNTADHAGPVTVSGHTTGVEDGRTVAVQFGASTYTATVTSGVWSLSVPSSAVAAIPDGSYIVHAVVSDGAANVAVADAALKVDTTASLTIGQVYPGDVINAVESLLPLPISGTAVGIEEGRTVTVTLHGQTYFAQVTGGAWTVTVPSTEVSSLNDGAFTISATAQDAAGNPASVSRGLHVDATASLTLDPIVGDNVINAGDHTGAVTISGHTSGVENGRVVSVLLENHSYTATVLSDSWSLSVPSAQVAALRDGSYTVFASVSDLAGNAMEATRSLVVDTTASIAINAIAVDSVVDAMERQLELPVSGSVNGIEDGQTVSVFLATHTYQAVVSGGVWSLNVPASDVGALSEGAYTISASALDLPGNSASATRAFVVDTSATIALDPMLGDNVVNAVDHTGALPISGVTTGVEDGRTVTVLLANHSYTATVSGGAWSLTVGSADISALTDGAYTVHASVTDRGGNPAAINQTLVVDTSAAIAIGTVSIDDVINANEKLLALPITGTVSGIEDGQTVAVVLNGSTYSTTVSAGAWSILVGSSAVAALVDGNYTISATALDVPGNPATATRVMAVDTGATLAIDAIDVDDIVNHDEKAQSLVVSGTSTGLEAGRTVTVLVAGQNYTASVGVGGAWSVTVLPAILAPLADGGYEVSVSATDLAGNPATAIRNFQLDTYVPVPAVDGLSTNSHTPVITGEAVVGPTDVLTVVVAGTTYHVGDGHLGINGGHWTLSDVTLADGHYDVTAEVVDLAGNTAIDASTDEIWVLNGCLELSRGEFESGSLHLTLGEGVNRLDGIGVTNYSDVQLAFQGDLVIGDGASSCDVYASNSNLTIETEGNLRITHSNVWASAGGGLTSDSVSLDASVTLEAAGSIYVGGDPTPGDYGNVVAEVTTVSATAFILLATAVGIELAAEGEVSISGGVAAEEIGLFGDYVEANNLHVNVSAAGDVSLYGAAVEQLVVGGFYVDVSAAQVDVTAGGDLRLAGAEVFQGVVVGYAEADLHGAGVSLAANSIDVVSAFDSQLGFFMKPVGAVFISQWGVAGGYSADLSDASIDMSAHTDISVVDVHIGQNYVSSYASARLEDAGIVMKAGGAIAANEIYISQSDVSGYEVLDSSAHVDIAAQGASLDNFAVAVVNIGITQEAFYGGGGDVSIDHADISVYGGTDVSINNIGVSQDFIFNYGNIAAESAHIDVEFGRFASVNFAYISQAVMTAQGTVDVSNAQITLHGVSAPESYIYEDGLSLSSAYVHQHDLNGAEVDAENALVKANANNIAVTWAEVRQDNIHAQSLVDLSDAHVELSGHDISGYGAYLSVSAAGVDQVTVSGHEIDASDAQVSVAVDSGFMLSIHDAFISQQMMTAEGGLDANIDASGALVHISGGDVVFEHVGRAFVSQSMMTASGTIDISDATVLVEDGMTSGFLSVAAAYLTQHAIHAESIDASDALVSVAGYHVSLGVARISQYGMYATGEVDLSNAAISVAGTDQVSVGIMELHQDAITAGTTIDAQGAKLALSGYGVTLGNAYISQEWMSADTIDISEAVVDIHADSYLLAGHVGISQSYMSAAGDIDAAGANIHMSSGGAITNYGQIQLLQHAMLGQTGEVDLSDAQITVESGDVIIAKGGVTLLQESIVGGTIDASNARVSMSGQHISALDVVLGQYAMTASDGVDASGALISIGANAYVSANSTSLTIDRAVEIAQWTMQGGTAGVDVSEAQVDIWSGGDLRIGGQATADGVVGVRINQIDLRGSSVDGSGAIVHVVAAGDAAFFGQDADNGRTAVANYVGIGQGLVQATAGDADFTGAWVGVTADGDLVWRSAAQYGAYTAEYSSVGIQQFTMYASGAVMLSGAEVDVSSGGYLSIEGGDVLLQQQYLTAGGDVIGTDARIYLSAGGAIDVVNVDIIQSHVTAVGTADFSGAMVAVSSDAAIEVNGIWISQTSMHAGEIDLHDALVTVSGNAITVSPSGVFISQGYLVATAGDVDIAHAGVTLSGGAIYMESDGAYIDQSNVIASGDIHAEGATVDINFMPVGLPEVRAPYLVISQEFLGAGGTVDVSEARVEAVGGYTERIARAAIYQHSISAEVIDAHAATVDLGGYHVSIGQAYISQSNLTAAGSGPAAPVLHATGDVDLSHAAIDIGADDLTVGDVFIAQENIRGTIIDAHEAHITVAGTSVSVGNVYISQAHMTAVGTIDISDAQIDVSASDSLTISDMPSIFRNNLTAGDEFDGSNAAINITAGSIVRSGAVAPDAIEIAYTSITSGQIEATDVHVHVNVNSSIDWSGANGVEFFVAESHLVATAGDVDLSGAEVIVDVNGDLLAGYSHADMAPRISQTDITAHGGDVDVSDAVLQLHGFDTVNIFGGGGDVTLVQQALSASGTIDAQNVKLEISAGDAITAGSVALSQGYMTGGDIDVSGAHVGLFVNEGAPIGFGFPRVHAPGIDVGQVNLVQLNLDATLGAIDANGALVVMESDKTIVAQGIQLFQAGLEAESSIDIGDARVSVHAELDIVGVAIGVSQYDLLASVGDITADMVSVGISAASSIQASYVLLDQALFTAGGDIDMSGADIVVHGEGVTVVTVELAQTSLHAGGTVDISDATLDIWAHGTLAGTRVALIQADIATAADVSADNVVIDIDAHGDIRLTTVDLGQTDFTASGEIDASGAHLFISAHSNLTATLVELEQGAMTAGIDVDLSSAQVSIHSGYSPVLPYGGELSVGGLHLAQHDISAGGTVDLSDASVEVYSNGSYFDATIIELVQDDVTATHIQADHAHVSAAASVFAEGLRAGTVELTQSHFTAVADIDACFAEISVDAIQGGGTVVPSVVSQLVELDQNGMRAGGDIDLQHALIDIGAAGLANVLSVELLQHDFSAVGTLDLSDALVDVHPAGTFMDGLVELLQTDVHAAAEIVADHAEIDMRAGTASSVSHVWLEQAHMTAAGDIDLSNAQISIAVVSGDLRAVTVGLEQATLFSGGTLDVNDAAIDIAASGGYSGLYISLNQNHFSASGDISAEYASIDVSADTSISFQHAQIDQVTWTAGGDVLADGTDLHISAGANVTASRMEIHQASVTANETIDFSNATVSLGGADLTLEFAALSQDHMTAAGTIDIGEASIEIVADGTFGGHAAWITQGQISASTGDITADFASVDLVADAAVSVSVVAVLQSGMTAGGSIHADGASVHVSSGDSLDGYSEFYVQQLNMSADDTIDMEHASVELTADKGMMVSYAEVFQSALDATTIDVSDAAVHLSYGHATGADLLHFDRVQIRQFDFTASDIAILADATVEIDGLNRDVIPNDTIVGDFVGIEQWAVTAPIIDAHGATISIAGNQISLANVYISQDLTATTTLDVSDARIHIEAWGSLQLDALPMVYHSTLQDGGLYNASGVQLHITANTLTVEDNDSTLFGFSYDSIVDGALSLADNVVDMKLDSDMNLANGLGSGSAIAAFIEMSDLHATAGNLDASGAGVSLEAHGTLLSSYVPSIELHELTAKGDVSIGGAELSLRAFDDIIIDNTSTAAWIEMATIDAGGDIMGASVHLHISAGGTVDSTAIGISLGMMTADGLIDLSDAEIHVAGSVLEVTSIGIVQAFLDGGTVDVSDALVDVQAHLIPAGLTAIEILQWYGSATSGDFDASGATITISVDGDATVGTVGIAQFLEMATAGEFDASNAHINISAMGGHTLSIDLVAIEQMSLGGVTADVSGAQIMVSGIESDTAADLHFNTVEIWQASLGALSSLDGSDALIDIEGGMVDITMVGIEQVSLTSGGVIDLHGAAITLHADDNLTVASPIEIDQHHISATGWLTLGGGGIDVSGATVMATMIDITAYDITASAVTFDDAVLHLDSETAGFTVAHDLAIDLTADASVITFDGNEISVHSGVGYTAHFVTMGVDHEHKVGSVHVDNQAIDITAVGSITVDGLVGIDVTAHAGVFGFNHNVIDMVAGASSGGPSAPINGPGILVDQVGFDIDNFSTAQAASASWNTIDLSATGDITVLHDVSLHLDATLASNADMGHNLIDIDAGTVFMASYVGVYIDVGTAADAHVFDNTIDITAGTSISVGHIDSGHELGHLSTYDFGNEVTLDAPSVTVSLLELYGYTADLFITADHAAITSLEVGSAQAEIYLDRYTNTPHPDYNITIYDLSVAMNSGLGDRVGTGGDGGGFDQIDLYGLGITSANQLSHTFVGGFVETGGGGQDWTVADVLIHATAANSSITIDLHDVHLNYTDYSLAPTNAQVWDDLINNALRFTPH